MPDEMKPTSRSQIGEAKPIDGSGFAANAALTTDPAYEELVVKYQNAEWEACERILGELAEKYPGNSLLADFKRDLEVQKTLKRIGVQDKKKRRQHFLVTVLLNLVFVLILVGVGYFLVTQIMNSYQVTQMQNSMAAEQVQLENLKKMENQAWGLLGAGKPDLALSLVAQIEAIDPDYPAIDQIRENANAQIAVIAVYDQAVKLMDQQDYAAALPLLQQIEAQSPYYRDVRARIEVIERYNHVRDLVAAAEAAYAEKNWISVITNYEEAVELDADVSTETAKQQLLTSYLRGVIATLSKADPSIDEILQAEKYYQKAMALIPQSKTYSAEREELQNLSVKLLASKYYQLGKQILADPAHTEKEVEAAANYLSRAFTLEPYDLELNTETGKAQTYLAALRNYNARKWDQAIEGLTKLRNVDPTYPNGLGLQMLYEAYRARGQRYYNGGFFLDARRDFEAAEILAFGEPENKLRLMEIQINVGNTLGKLDDFQNAASYYKYAFEMVKAAELGAENEAFVADLAAAADLFAQGKYIESYTQYLRLIEQIPLIYSFETIEASGGQTLVYLADVHHSSVQAIQIQNELDNNPSLPYLQTLIIPFIP